MFTRSLQLDQFIKYSDKSWIKVITGVRRSGKSILLRQVKDSLRRSGVSMDQLHVVRFNQLHRQLLIDWPSLAASIEKKFAAKKENYLFLDELDQVDAVVPLLQDLLSRGNVNLFVTAATRSLIGRLSPLRAQLVVIPVLPLGFSEFCRYQGHPADHQALYRYLNTGGFPFAQGVHDAHSLGNYLDEVFNTILVGGFTKHGTLCNPFLTKQLAIFLATQLGEAVNASKAVSGLRAAGVSVSNKTLATYLTFLQDTFLFYPCYELDLARNRTKPTNVKYYPVDPSLRNYLTNQKGALSQANLEALLFIELVRRGYLVHSSKRSYIQFRYSLRSQHDYDQVLAATLPASAHKQLIVMQAGDMVVTAPDLPLIRLTDWLVTPQVNPVDHVAHGLVEDDVGPALGGEDKLL
ncbi:AAA family ATPase [Limosilactobacillus pontis]|nr:AAA family ATPase [Limosilactobacillus pontis]MCX2187890.1 AAA family ATPase [Limosilactobacillus pontis]